MEKNEQFILIYKPEFLYLTMYLIYHGFAFVKIYQMDEHFKVVSVEFFYDPGELIGGLLKGAKLDTSDEALKAGSSCPILRNTGQKYLTSSVQLWSWDQ